MILFQSTYFVGDDGDQNMLVAQGNKQNLPYEALSFKNPWCFFWTTASKYVVVRSMVTNQNEGKERDLFRLRQIEFWHLTPPFPVKNLFSSELQSSGFGDQHVLFLRSLGLKNLEDRYFRVMLVSQYPACVEPHQALHWPVTLGPLTQLLLITLQLPNDSCESFLLHFSLFLPRPT